MPSVRFEDPVAHQVAVALLDDVAEVNADAEIDALIGGHSDVALDHRVLNRDGAAYGFDDAVELDHRPVASALEHAPVLAGDRGIDEVGAQRPQPRERAIPVRARHPAEADDVGGEDRRDFPGLGHSAPLLQTNLAQRLGYSCSGSKIVRFERRKTTPRRWPNVRNGSTPAGRRRVGSRSACDRRKVSFVNQSHARRSSFRSPVSFAPSARNLPSSE